MTPSSYGGSSGLTSGAMTPNMAGRFEGLESVVGSRQSSFSAVKTLMNKNRNRDDDLADVSCFCIPGHHPLREDLYDIISHWTFDNFMFLLIFISCVIMAMEKPDLVRGGAEGSEGGYFCYHVTPSLSLTHGIVCTTLTRE